MTLTRKIKESIYDLIDLGSHIDVASTTKAIAKKLGLNDRMINYTHIEVRNYLNQSKFEHVPIKDRILFLPHCLRNTEKCKGKYGGEGLVCAHCGNCQISEITKLAQAEGYQKIFVVPGGSMVIKLVKKYSPKAILGVACYNEISMAMDKLKGAGMPAIGVLLLRDGCQNTLASIDEIKEKLTLGKDRAIQKGQ